jgi:hypothetical protein
MAGLHLSIDLLLSIFVERGPGGEAPVIMCE